MVDSHLLLSGSCRSVPSYAVICRRGEARASVIVLALKPCPASKGVQLIAELNAVLYMRKSNCLNVNFQVSILCIITFCEAAC